MAHQPHLLIAVDSTDAGLRVGRGALHLFGREADYTFVHVAEPVPMTPPMTPAAVPAAPVTPTSTPVDDAATRDSARSIAASVAHELGLETATSVGLLGAPADVIVTEAAHRAVDAIVVGAHESHWFADLLSKSTVEQVEQSAAVPVLVVPVPG